MFDQLRESYINSITESASITDQTKPLMIDKFSSMRLFVPPFNALSFLAQTVDTAVVADIPDFSTCADVLLLPRAARTFRAASFDPIFSEEQIQLSNIDLTDTARFVRYQPAPVNGIIISPLALSIALYQPPSDSVDPYTMVDAYSRLGWRIAREMASAVSEYHRLSNEQLALCAIYRVLCKHGMSKCAAIETGDLDWIQRIFWDVAATHCGDTASSTRIDAAANAYSLYRVAFGCNGKSLFANASAVVLDCWKK